MTSADPDPRLRAAYDAVYRRGSVAPQSIETTRWPRDRNEAALFLAGRGQRVLEVGCGDGDVLRALTTRFEQVVGVELSPNRVANSRHRLEDRENVAVHEGDVEAGLPFPKEHFDCVVWADVIEHVVDVWAAMREIVRVLEPGGRLVTVTPNIAGIRKRVTLLRGRFPSTSGRSEGIDVREGELFDGGHLHYFTFSSIEALYRAEGLEPTGRLGFGRFGRAHHARPNLLSGSVAVVGIRPLNA